MTSQHLLAIVSGGLIGLLLGTTGGGGSLMAIPLLVYVVGVPVQSAAAMSLVVVGYSALFGAWRKSRENQVRGLAAFVFSATGALGAWIGAHGHGLFQPDLILFIFGVFMLGIGALTFLRSRAMSESEGGEGCAQQFSVLCVVKALGIGFVVGILNGFFGIGGGFIIVPALFFVLGFPMPMAIGTSLLIIALTSLGGIAGHLDMAGLNGPLVVMVMGGSIVGMLLGVRVAQSLEGPLLTRMFSILVIVVGVFIMVDNGGRLMN